MRILFLSFEKAHMRLYFYKLKKCILTFLLIFVHLEICHSFNSRDFYNLILVAKLLAIRAVHYAQSLTRGSVVNVKIVHTFVLVHRWGEGVRQILFRTLFLADFLLFSLKICDL